MSAYVVDREHVVYLAQVGQSRRLNMGHRILRWSRGNGEMAMLTCMDREGAQRVAQMLWDECIASVLHAYPNDTRDTMPGPVGEDYELHAADFARHPAHVEPVEVLKACDCYEYQSCEHPGWATSEAHAYIEALRRHAWQSLVGYEDAEWGAPKGVYAA